MKKSKLKILGLVNDIPLVKRGVSGSRSLVYNHLRERGHIADVIDADLSSLHKKIVLLKNFSLNQNRWMLKYNLDVYAKVARTRILEKLFAGMDADFDATLQVGSTFSLHNITQLKTVPRFSYHDNNAAVYFKSGFDSFNISNNRRYQEIYRKAYHFEKEVYDNLTGIFCMTEYLKQSFIEDFRQDEKKVHVVGFGCNFDIDSIEDIEKDYSSRTLLFVAKDSFREKGGYLLLEAFSQVRKKMPDAELIIVGKKLNHEQPGVTWLGLIDKSLPGGTDKLRQLYRKASIFVLPSFGEPAGNVFLEAMAYKLPCIGAKQGATSEIIVGNNCGLVVDNDAGFLADNIIELLEDEDRMRQFGSSGFRTIQEKYNWDIVCDRVVDSIRKYG